jgi:hypothetical protein
MQTYPQHLIFYPMFSVFILTFLALQYNLFTRITAVRSGKVKIGYFKNIQGPAPEKVIQVGNHVNNLFQAPPIFYIICLTILHFGKVDGPFVLLAWAYAFFRYGHSAIHLTINKVQLRMPLYVLSTIVLAILWIRFCLIISVA